MKQKGLAPILIVVLIAILAVGGYLIYKQQAKPTPPPQQTTQPSPTPVTTSVPNGATDTTNWKVYTSSNLNLSFKYPPEITVEENQIGDFYFLTIRANKASIGIAPKNKYTDSPCTFGQPLPTITRTPITIKVGDEESNGELSIIDGAQTLTCKPIVLHGYDFFLNYPSLNDETKNIFDQILSTFKFTN